MLTVTPDRTLAAPTPSPEYFDGAVFMQPLVSKNHSSELEMIAVFFEDGARTIPHTHSTDQVLLVVSGHIVVADADGRRELAAGDLAHVPAGRWHWHGAVSGHSACHISIRKPGPSDWSLPRRDW